MSSQGRRILNRIGDYRLICDIKDEKVVRSYLK